MSLRIVPEGCRVENGKFVIVLEGAAPDEVTGPTANQLAIQYASSCGYPRVGINGQTGSYPVDSSGNSYEDWNDQSKRGLISAYRNEIKMMGGL